MHYIYSFTRSIFHVLCLDGSVAINSFHAQLTPVDRSVRARAHAHARLPCARSRPT